MLTNQLRFDFYINNLKRKKNNDTKRHVKIIKELEVKKKNQPYLLKKNENYFDLKIPIDKCIVVLNDGYNNKKFPCLMKTRLSNDISNNSIIIKTNIRRHWTSIRKVLNDISFEKKKNEIIFRGSSTGCDEKLREKFCSLYRNKYDVGISNLCHGCNDKKLLKNKLTINEMCKYKFIVSIRGNDKDSGLNWKLFSNSVVLMRKPKFHSWLCENFLEEYVHYVPLNDSLTNLDEQFTWCMKNLEKCKKIAKESKKFIQTFLNEKNEKEMISRVFNHYQNSVEIS